MLKKLKIPLLVVVGIVMLLIAYDYYNTWQLEKSMNEYHPYRVKDCMVARYVSDTDCKTLGQRLYEYRVDILHDSHKAASEAMKCEELCAKRFN